MHSLQLTFPKQGQLDLLIIFVFMIAQTHKSTKKRDVNMTQTMRNVKEDDIDADKTKWKQRNTKRVTECGEKQSNRNKIRQQTQK